MPYYSILYGFYMRSFYQSPSILSVSGKQQENGSCCFGILMSLLWFRCYPSRPHWLKPSGRIMPCKPGDCISVIEGLLFNFTFLKSAPCLLKFLIQLLHYFPVFLFATCYSAVCISASVSLFASVVVSEWDLLHKPLQIRKKRHAHSLTLFPVVRHLMDFGGITSGLYRDFGTFNYSLSVFSLTRAEKGY